MKRLRACGGARSSTPEAAPEPALPAAPAPVNRRHARRSCSAVEEAWRRWRQSPGLPSDVLVPVRARFESALTTVMTTHAAALQGTVFDLEQTKKRMKTLCDDVESVTRGLPDAALGSTSVSALATLLKEKLAANTIGGRVNEEAKVRAAADRVRRAQMTWRDLGPVPGTEGNQLEARFHRAVPPVLRAASAVRPAARRPPRASRRIAAGWRPRRRSRTWRRPGGDRGPRRTAISGRARRASRRRALPPPSPLFPQGRGGSFFRVDRAGRQLAKMQTPSSRRGSGGSGSRGVLVLSGSVLRGRCSRAGRLRRSAAGGLTPRSRGGRRGRRLRRRCGTCRAALRRRTRRSRALRAPCRP